MEVYTSVNSAEDNTRFNWDGNRLSHAYIVAGRLADTIAMAAVCSGHGGTRPCMKCTHCYKAMRHIHPDVTEVDRLPDKREILIDQLRELKKDVIVVPNEAEKKAYIINNADTMNTKAQNAFLQMLEEPPAHVVFILRTENPVALLPTVRSRCVHLKANQQTDTSANAAMEIANEFYSAIERGNATLIEFMFRLEKLDKNDFFTFLTSARELAALKLGSTLSSKPGLPYETIACVERILVRAGSMFDLNIGIGHISGMICAKLLTVNN